jgi:glycosyltransferase involved in cell wall biosynthesis
VWIVGEGWQKNNLTALGIAKGLEAHLCWLGKVHYQQLGHFLRQADIFIFPTLEDVWGMAVPEAMIFGKPILCSKWAGSAELVIDGQNGYHFDPKQPQQLAKLMKDYIDAPEKITQMGIKSQQAMKKYEVKKAAQFIAEFAMNTVNFEK